VRSRAGHPPMIAVLDCRAALREPPPLA